VDTTAAGDSFNAGYLSARLNGQSPIEAAHLGQQIASIVVQHPGAIVPREQIITRSISSKSHSEYKG